MPQWSLAEQSEWSKLWLMSEQNGSKLKSEDLSHTAAPPHSVAPKSRLLLVVDDDDLSHQSIQLLRPSGWESRHYKTAVIESSLVEKADCALVDMHLTGNTKHAEGLEVIRQMRGLNPQLDIIAMSGDLSPQLMREGLDAGALLFLAKPLAPEEFLSRLTKTEARLLHTEAIGRSNASDAAVWVGSSSPSVTVRRRISDFAGELGPFLISGETGTGKDVAARLIHKQEQPRGRRPFIAINCAALSETLFESELFGHVKGAFTGADQNKMGLIEAANGGDLFLDEIQELSLASQAKLLRFFETGEIRRVGSQTSVRPKVRIIAATNQNLAELVELKRFREDLLWRLKRFELSLPPLRERTEDIGELIRYFSTLDPVRKSRVWSESAIETLRRLPFRGNIRELKRIVEQVLLYSPLPIIDREEVLRQLSPSTSTNFSQSDFEGNSSASRGLCAQPLEGLSWPAWVFDHSQPLADRLSQFEAMILQAAVDAESDLDKLAAKLQVSRSSLYKKLKDYGVERKKG